MLFSIKRHHAEKYRFDSLTYLVFLIFLFLFLFRLFLLLLIRSRQESMMFRTPINIFTCLGIKVILRSRIVVKLSCAIIIIPRWFVIRICADIRSSCNWKSNSLISRLRKITSRKKSKLAKIQKKVTKSSNSSKN